MIYKLINKEINKHNDKNFLEEKNIVNNYYKQFFMKYSYDLSSHQLLNNLEIFSSNRDKTNFGVILSSKGQWNYFLRYFCICQKKIYVLMILIFYIIGGLFGIIILGIQADIKGRKKIIHLALFIMLLGFTIITIYFNYLDSKYLKYKKIFRKKYKYSNKYNIKYDEILEDIYAQQSITKLVNNSFIVYLMGVFITNFAACPLIRVCLSLLLENATNDHVALQNLRKYRFFLRGASPIISSIFIVNLNSTALTNYFICFFILLLFISSFFILNESMRYLYEYCEWEKLSEFIMKNFVFEDQKDIQFLTGIQLKLLKRDENEIINKEYETRRLNLNAENENDDIFEKNNFYNYYQRKKSFLIRGIRRKEDIIIKYKEIDYNPSILLICLQSNRHYIRTRFLICSILILINFFLNLLQKEMLKKPFFRERDLFISKNQNFIFNSNFLGLTLVIFISNFFYYYLYRISCYKIVIIISYIFLSVLCFAYYIHSLNSDKTPIYLNKYNFGMINLFYNDYYRMNQMYIHGMYFMINGIYFYIHIFIIKISKTIYRCIVFSLHAVLILLSRILVEMFSTEIKKPFLLLGFINFLCLILILFLNEIDDSYKLINDLKKNVGTTKYN